jgi:hypothetical protein
MRKSVISAIIAVAAVVSAGTASAQILKKEPAMGALREGQRVLVDDGSCPKGQIKEVIGGNHTSVGGNKQIVRQKRCIARK